MEHIRRVVDRADGNLTMTDAVVRYGYNPGPGAGLRDDLHWVLILLDPFPHDAGLGFDRMVVVDGEGFENVIVFPVIVSYTHPRFMNSGNALLLPAERYFFHIMEAVFPPADTVINEIVDQVRREAQIIIEETEIFLTFSGFDKYAGKK